MSRKRRNFSAKFKSDLVIELLKGEKDLNTLATENNIQPNLLRNWKREFLNNASAVFDDKREENLKEKLVEEWGKLKFPGTLRQSLSNLRFHNLSSLRPYEVTEVTLMMLMEKSKRLKTTEIY